MEQQYEIHILKETILKLENNVNKAIEKVKPENYRNYFEHAYNY
jgi:hypothetical protein